MRAIVLVGILLALAVVPDTPAQSTAVSAPSAAKTLAATMNVFAFPAGEQTTEVQNREEAECYRWAVDTTKVDPFDLAKEAEQQMMTAEQRKAAVDQKGKGAGAKGALAGAAAGALIGEIASNDAGSGAAYGAGAGLLAARRRARRGKAQAKQEIDQGAQQAQQATAEQIEGFKKAFAVCLEAKDYLVKM